MPTPTPSCPESSLRGPRAVSAWPRPPVLLVRPRPPAPARGPQPPGPRPPSRSSPPGAARKPGRGVGRAWSQGSERAAGAAGPLYSRGGRGSRFRNGRGERPRGGAGRPASACITRPDSPPPGRREGSFGREPHLQGRRGRWSCRAGWPRPSPAPHGAEPREQALACSPGARASGRQLRPGVASGPPAALAGGASRPGARTAASQREGTCDAGRCLSARAPALPDWPLCPLRASCAGGWEYFGQVVFHFIKDVFYSLSGELWYLLGQYLFFSFNIFRSIKTLPVKYSPETQRGQSRKYFSNLNGRLLALWHFAQTTWKHLYQLFMTQCVCKAIVEFCFVFKTATVSSLRSGQKREGEQNSIVNGRLSQNAVTSFVVLPT